MRLFPMQQQKKKKKQSEHEKFEQKKKSRENKNSKIVEILIKAMLKIELDAWISTRELWWLHINFWAEIMLSAMFR